MPKQLFYKLFSSMRQRHSMLAVGVLCGILLMAIVGLVWLGYGFYCGRFAAQTPVSSEIAGQEDREHYWFDRTRREIDAIQRSNLKETAKTLQLQACLTSLQSQAQAIAGPYQRANAFKEIVLAQAACDLDLNIYGTLKGVDGGATIDPMRCRALAAIALMYLRLENEYSSKTAVLEYMRVLYDGDVRLDTIDSVLAFMDVTTTLAVRRDRPELERLFRWMTKENRRIPVPILRASGLRILAGQQARVGMKWEALATAAEIEDPIEQSRAYQSIIAAVARPMKVFRPVPSQLQPLSTEGPWEPIENPEETRQCVDSILAGIAKVPDAVQQASVLHNLVASRLMCDAMIYPIFEQELEKTDLIESRIKEAALALAKEPRSAVIRAARGLPPLPAPTTGPIESDTAADNWGIVEEVSEMPRASVDPEAVRNVQRQQMTRTRISMAQAILGFGNRQDARATLSKAFESAKDQDNPYYRVNNLQGIGSLQVMAGDLEAARVSLSLARQEYQNFVADKNRRGVTVTETLAAEIAMTQLRARLIDDAIETTKLLTKPAARNDLLVLIAKERLRTGQWQEANTVLELLRDDDPRKEALMHRAEGKGVPPNERSDPEKVVFRLTTDEEYTAAAACLPDISVPIDRQARRIRIIRGLIGVGTPYVGRDEESRRIRQEILTFCLRLAREQETPRERAAALELVISAFASGPVYRQSLDTLREAVYEAEEIFHTPEAEQGASEMLSRLALARLLLVVPEERYWGDWPILAEDKNQATLHDVENILHRALTLLRDDSDPYFRLATYSNAVRGFGQIGRIERAVALLDESQIQLRTLNDPERDVVLLKQFAAAALKLGRSDQGKQLFTEAITKTISIASGVELAPEQWSVIGIRARERVLEDIVRDQLKCRLVDEAIRTIPRISEQVVRNRLYRMAAYQLMFDDRARLGEEVAGRISEPSLRLECMRDAMLIQGGGSVSQRFVTPPGADILTPAIPVDMLPSGKPSTR